jgi:hypothetical protein
VNHGHQRRKDISHRYIKYIQQNNSRKFSNSQERDAIQVQEDFWGIKQTSTK